MEILVGGRVLVGFIVRPDQQESIGRNDVLPIGRIELILGDQNAQIWPAATRAEARVDHDRSIYAAAVQVINEMRIRAKSSARTALLRRRLVAQ